MFEFLKKKISGFTEKLKETIQGRQATKPQTPPVEHAAKETEQIPEQQTAKPASAAGNVPAEKPKISKGKKTGKKRPQKIREKPAEQEPTETEKEKTENPVEKEAKPDIAGESRSTEQKIKEVRKDEKRDLKAKVGLAKKLFGFLGGRIKISAQDTENFFGEFELSLLEGDVEQNAAEAIVKELKSRIIGSEIGAKEDVTQFIKEQIRASLLAIMETQKIDLFSSKSKPVKVLFLGPNGAGKTTSIAKVANYLISKNKTVLLAAGDTFRAASIEQLEAHAEKIGVKVIKHKYGSDPAAVAFDAVKAALARGIDFVLIDTAGRQETNKNLIEELKKMERVIKPDFRIYVGEAYTGQALLQQASEFNRAIGIDGFILTKIDTDAKGGTAISLLYSLKKPIIFVGTGQRYSDLLEFKPEFIIDRII